MKGVVFTELMNLVESEFSEELADDVLDSVELTSGGSYTAVGYYDYKELLQIVGALSERTNVPVADLVRTFGRHLFGHFHKSYPQMFEGSANAFDFLRTVENHIHVEVRKLYPDAELPTFDYELANDSTLFMTYRSPRPFADLAEGLIGACFDHFGQKMRMKRTDLPSENGTAVRFELCTNTT